MMDRQHDEEEARLSTFGCNYLWHDEQGGLEGARFS